MAKKKNGYSEFRLLNLAFQQQKLNALEMKWLKMGHKGRTPCELSPSNCFQNHLVQKSLMTTFFFHFCLNI